MCFGKWAPIQFVNLGYFSHWGSQDRLLDSGTGGREVALWGPGLSTASVHHVAVLSRWTAEGLALTSFPGKGCSGMWRKFRGLPHLSLWGPCLYTQEE